MFEEPNFLVQVGHNGHLVTRNAVEQDWADGAILSPSDFESMSNQELSQQIQQEGGIVLFDPQFYIPRTERPKLEDYTYFRIYGGEDFETTLIEDEEERRDFCQEVLSAQDNLEVDAYITPNRFLDTFSDQKIEQWRGFVETFLEVAEEDGRDIPIFASLPLADKPVVDKEQREKLLNVITGVDVDGFYVSVMFEDSVRYPLANPSNVYSVMDLLHVLKQNKYEVIVGHTHHVAHLFLGIGINAFSAGHYKNLRAFDVRRWKSEEGEIYSPPAVNYYSGNLLNDLRVDQDLDLLYQTDFDISEIRSESPVEEELFSGAVPSQVGWNLRESWDHYIWSCGEIAKTYRDADGQTRFERAQNKVDEAEQLYEKIKRKVGPLAEPKPRIYEDWRAALNLIRKDLDFIEEDET